MNSQTVTAQRPLGSRPWKKEEEEYLEEKWGYSSVPSIALYAIPGVESMYHSLSKS